jgi:hypothetical protein
MKPIFLFSFILIFSILCISDTIDVSRPYSSGIIGLSSYRFDTLLFSNGVNVSPCYYRTGTAEEIFDYHSIVLEHYLLAGFKHVQTANYQYESMDSISYYSNNDTNWVESIALPDSLIPLDQIIDGWQDYTIILRNGKWIIRSYASVSEPRKEFTLKGFNIIIYVKTKINNMKIQICNAHFIVKENSYNPKIEISLDSLQIRWAVDSLGNGIFNFTTDVNSDRFNPASKNLTKTQTRECSSAFNLLGMKLVKTKYNSTHSPSGIYIDHQLNSTHSGKAKCSYKPLIKFR